MLYYESRAAVETARVAMGKACDAYNARRSELLAAGLTGGELADAIKVEYLAHHEARSAWLRARAFAGDDAAALEIAVGAAD
jgi:hypothetical protein